MPKPVGFGSNDVDRHLLLWLSEKDVMCDNNNSLFITGKEVWLRFTVNESEGHVLAWQRWSLLHTERRSSIRRPVLSTPKTQPENCCWHCTTTCVSIPQSHWSISAHANTRSCHCHLLSEQTNNGTDICEWSNLSWISWLLLLHLNAYA